MNNLVNNNLKDLNLEKSSFYSATGRSLEAKIHYFFYHISNNSRVFIILMLLITTIFITDLCSIAATINPYDAKVLQKSEQTNLVAA